MNQLWGGYVYGPESIFTTKEQKRDNELFHLPLPIIGDYFFDQLAILEMIEMKLSVSVKKDKK